MLKSRVDIIREQVRDYVKNGVEYVTEPEIYKIKSRVSATPYIPYKSDYATISAYVIAILDEFRRRGYVVNELYVGGAKSHVLCGEYTKDGKRVQFMDVGAMSRTIEQLFNDVYDKEDGSIIRQYKDDINLNRFHNVYSKAGV